MITDHVGEEEEGVKGDLQGCEGWSTLIMSDGKSVKVSEEEIRHSLTFIMLLGAVFGMDGWEAVAVQKPDRLIKGSDELLMKQKIVVDKIRPHQNLCRFIGASSVRDFSRGNGFIVMEHHPLTLKAALFDGEKIQTYLDVLLVLEGIAAGLEHLHHCGIVHFDITPSNILLSEEGTAKISEFSLARVKGSMGLFTSGYGTRGYMAPEVLIGGWCHSIMGKSAERKVQITTSADIYSFGVLAYICAHGHTTVAHDQCEQTIRFGGIKPTEVACDCPEPLRELIEECLQFSIGALDTLDFGRPSAGEAKERLKSMKNEDWARNRLMWKVEQPQL